MRIVDVCAFYAPEGGGVKTYVDRKLVVGPRAGHDITIVAPAAEARVEERGPHARIIWLEQPRFPLDHRYHYFNDEPLLHATLDALNPDIVEASSPWSSASKVGNWRGDVPKVLIMHCDPLSVYAYRWFGRVMPRPLIDRQFGWFWRHLLRLDRQFDLTVSATYSLSERLEAGGMSNVVTNPMGVADDFFSPALRDEALRARLLERCGLGSDATLLIGAGRHAPEKRWPMVIEAVMAAGAHHPVGMVLVGDGRDRTRIVRQVGANPHIQLLSPVFDRREFARLLASGDALIHGGEAETFCMVAAEARASGLPLIVPDEGATATHARDSGGWSYASADAAACKAAVMDFLAADRDAARGRARVASLHMRTMDRHFADLFPVYENLIVPARKAA